MPGLFPDCVLSLHGLLADRPHHWARACRYSCKPGMCLLLGLSMLCLCVMPRKLPSHKCKLSAYNLGNLKVYSMQLECPGLSTAMCHVYRNRLAGGSQECQAPAQPALMSTRVCGATCCRTCHTSPPGQCPLCPSSLRALCLGRYPRATMQRGACCSSHPGPSSPSTACEYFLHVSLTNILCLVDNLLLHHTYGALWQLSA